MKVVVVGTSCSGKSTFARAMASRQGIACVELDALFWEPGWIEAPIEIFRERVESALGVQAWVAEGNYRKVRDLLWTKAETLIWLDYPFHIVLSRALLRTVKRIVTREVLWNSNRESFRKSFLSRQSILLWVLQTYPQRKREYPELLSRPEYGHLKVLRFRSPKEAKAYLEST
jgi:adenylate kinase family enzyme